MNPQQSILELFQKSKTIFIGSHYHPDGDALGASLALALGLQALGKKTYVYNRDPIPYNLTFLPAVSTVSDTIPETIFDVGVMVDCGQPVRVSDAFEKARKSKKFGSLVCIDHHLLDKKVGDINWVLPEAASTGVIIWDLLESMHVPITADIANLIFTTLTVDTGSFRYSNTTVDVFRLCAALVEKGASPWFVAQHLEESNPPARFQLLGLCLQTLKVGFGGKYASMDVTQAMLKTVKGKKDLTEEFSNIPRSIAGVEVSAFFREETNGKIKVSLRSKNKVDVAAIAKNYKGGGHEHAAGCNFETSLAEAKRQIEAIIQGKLK